MDGFMDERSTVSDEEQSSAPAVQEKGPRCLPIATLDSDFDGQPKDGAEYLAMIQREAAALPFTTSVAIDNVPGPSRHVALKPLIQPSSERIRVRHPALPKESWFVAFDGHFRSYRKSIRQALPEMGLQASKAAKSSTSPPRSIPSARAETEWLPFINGAKRKKMHRSTISHATQQDKGKSQFALDLDEEELLNDAPPEAASRQQMTDRSSSDSPDPAESGSSSAFFYESESPKHRPQEPTLLVLAMFNQERIYAALKALNSKMEAYMSDIDGSSSLIETQPGSTEGVSSAATALPLTPLHARWLFALLLFLEDYLPPDELAELRRVAKTCLRICKWQVISGKVDQQGVGISFEQEEMRVACWITIRAIATGWNQHDLPQDAEMMFAKLAQSST